jgi:hypothetical protein
MINIIVDFDKDEVEIEGTHYKLPGMHEHLDTLIMLLTRVLNDTHYSGESVCIEKKIKGFFTELDRWHANP